MSSKLSFLLALVFLTTFACNSVSSEEKALREQAREKLTKPQPKKSDRINKLNDNKIVVEGPTTSIQFKESKYDFGKVNEGEKVKHSFVYTNTGTEPLVIQNAKGSCGCTVPTYSKEPLAPGESAKIDVVFDSKGRPGKTNKNVTITANTEPVKTKIFIVGQVKKKKK